MDWKGAFLDNWPYKAAALVLAVLLWFNVSADQDRTEQTVATRLVLEFTDEEWVPVEVPREVRTTFRGRLGDILALPGDVAIRRTIGEVEDSVVTVDLEPSMVEYDRRLAVQPVAVRPSRVEVRLHPRASKRVPVAIDLTASATAGHTIVGDPVIEPESVTVRGARGEVEAVTHVETEPIVIEGLEASTTRQIALRPPEDGATLQVEPDRVLATLRVDSLAERRFRVRLRADGPAASEVTLSPTEVEVILRGAAAELRDLSVREMTASVYVEEPPEGEATRPVEVSLPEGVSATAEVVPASVSLRPVGSAGPAGADGGTSPDTTGAGR